MSDKKPRMMSAKGLLHKATTSKSAIGFLSAHRQYMTTGLLAPLLSPIIAKVDEGKLLPTPAVQAISQAVMEHIILSDKLKAEDAIENAGKPGTQKSYLGTILDPEGNICTKINSKGEEEDLVKGFDMPQDAARWLERRLFEGEPTWYGVLEHAHSKCVETITRDVAIEHVLKKAKGPAVHSRGVSTKTLGFGTKVKESRNIYSNPRY